MRSKITLSVILAGLLVTVPVLAPKAHAQDTQPAPIQARLLPVAAGALVGAAAAFFVLPLVVPATAVAATAGASATAGPVFAAVGAGLGGFVGYEFAH